MRLGLILFVSLPLALVEGPISVCGNSDLGSGVGQSTLRPAVERVFSRKKRWMIFPKGSNLKFTINVSKRLLAMYPKGFNFVLEAAFYYPMPAARIDLIPQRLRKPSAAKVSATKTAAAPLYLVGVPGSLIKYRAKPAVQPSKVQRIDQNASSLHWLGPTSYQLPHKWSKYSAPAYLKQYQWSPQKQQKYVSPYTKYNNKWYTKPYRHRNGGHRWRYGREGDKAERHLALLDDLETEYQPIYFEDLEPFADSPHYHSYRVRRELFHHFEGLSQILGIDMKSCILRAVCDSKRFLLPPGYSLIQDILRIVFTFPTINGLRDDYTRVMETEYETCDAYIRNKCPFSILDWLLNSKRSM